MLYNYNFFAEYVEKRYLLKFKDVKKDSAFL
jgi:hypothetical protein